ncbi:MAG: hypothetical protein ACREJO_18870 [Phycisphaerales bacterium]
MTPLHPSSNTGGSGYSTRAAAPDTFYRRPFGPDSPSQPSAPPDAAQRWLQAGESRALARLRGPLVSAAQRVGLASRRCNQLEASVLELRHRLANAPNGVSSAERQWVEQRVFDLEKAIHDERLVLWRDLLPLAETARDAAIDSMRAGWLNELGRVLGGDAR